MKWLLVLAWLATATGCRQLLGFDTPALGGDATSGGSGDGPVGPPIDAPADCSTWTARHFDPCALPAPSGSLDLQGPWVFSTDTGDLTSAALPPIHPAGITIKQNGANNAKMYVISVASLMIEDNATVDVTGKDPLVVASWSTIEIDGTIDAGSTAAQAGAGSDPTQCQQDAAAQGQTGVSTLGSGGGGGGAFGGAGGHGGTGDSPPGPLGGVGGTAIAAPTFVRAGCSGAPSGQAGPGASNPLATSSGGSGGGALELAARTSIDVRGEVLAGGGGGGGAPLQSSCGGGGGGAGGYLGFDSTTIQFEATAVIAANGGGGGGGAPFASTGQPGQDGQASTTQAQGGAASTCSEAGMLGGAGSAPDGASSSNPIEPCGGAGGGGGVGFVLYWGVLLTSAATVSPLPVAGP